MNKRMRQGLAAIITGATAGGAGAESVTVYVHHKDFSIHKHEMMVEDAIIHVGDTIVWQWVDGFHLVVSNSCGEEQFLSPSSSTPGFTFSHTFTHIGVTEYYCAIHGSEFDCELEGMFGTITVLPTPLPCAGDLDASPGVDGIDLGILLASWSLPPDKPGCGGRDCPADINGDGFVNGVDLGILLANWGACD